MLEIFQNLEQMMERFAPLVVIVSGVVFLLLGLCMWLGGLALRKGFIAIAGLLGGCIVGLFVVGRNLFSASLTGALAMLSTLILEKLLVILLAATLAASVAFTVAAEPYFEKAEVTEVQQVQNETSEQTTITEPKDFILELKTFGLDSGRKIKQAAIKIPIHIWPIIATPALIVLICGVFLWRFTSVLFFSVLGTMASFFGVFLMLLYKGTEPVDYVRSRPIIFVVVFAVMAAFGMVIQLLLCKKSKKQKITKIKPGKSKTNKNNVTEKIVEHDWRSA
jgi:hypothetical protein